MDSDNKQNGTITGFSGLSTLVSDVDDACPEGKPVLDVVPTSSTSPPPAPPPIQAEVTPAAPTVSELPKNDGSSNVSTGKWMVGIGLGIGLLLIVFVNSSKKEPPHSPTPPVVYSPTIATPVNPTLTAVPATQGRQHTQDSVIQQSLTTESVNVLGQNLVFSNPNGYCTPGESAREAELMDIARRSQGEGSRLVHSAVLCSELEEYRKGQRDILDHWLQIRLIGPKGNFEKLDIPRESFLTALSKSSPRVNPTKINQKLKTSFENGDISLSDMKTELLGRDGNAVYSSIRMNTPIRTIYGISSITLLNSLPLSITVYEGTGSPKSRDRLQAVHQELLNSLLTEN